jgi:hypothetical protein
MRHRAALRGVLMGSEHIGLETTRTVPMRLTGYEGWHEEVAMRIVACGLIAGVALLGPVPVAMADAPVSTTSADSSAGPQAQVSLLAVSLTVGGALAMAGSGVALVLTRRRTVSRPPS